MLDIPATKSSPKVVFSIEERTLAITGECYPENPFEFFEPIFTALQAELPRLKEMRLRVQVPYMNSSSTKCMLDLLDLLAKKENHGCAARVSWHYDEGNSRALDLAEEFSEDIEIPFEILPVAAEDPGK